MLLQPHTREAAVWALHEGDGALPEAAGWHSELRPRHKYHSSGDTALLYYQWRIVIISIQILNIMNQGQKSKEVFVPRCTAVTGSLAQPKLRFTYLHLLPLCCGQGEKTPLTFPRVPSTTPYIPDILCCWRLLHSITLHSPSNYSFFYRWLTGWSGISCISLTFHSYFSCRSRAEVEATPYIHPTQTLNNKTFLLLKLKLIAWQDLCSHFHTAFILTLAIRWTISFFFKNYTTMFCFLLYVH